MAMLGSEHIAVCYTGFLGEPVRRGLHQLLGDKFEENPGRLFHGLLVKCYSHGQQKFTPYPINYVRQAPDGTGVEVELHILRSVGRVSYVPVKLEHVWPLKPLAGNTPTITAWDANYIQVVIDMLGTPAAFFIESTKTVAAKKRLLQSLATLARVRRLEEECDRQADAIAALELQLAAKRRELSGLRLDPVTRVYGMPTDRDKHVIMEEIAQLEGRINAVSARLQASDPGQDALKRLTDQVFDALAALWRAMHAEPGASGGKDPLQRAAGGVQSGCQGPRGARSPEDWGEGGGGGTGTGSGAELLRSQAHEYSELQLTYLDLCSEQLEFHKRNGSLSSDGSEVLWDRVPLDSQPWLRRLVDRVRAVRDELVASKLTVPGDLECVQHSLRRAVQARSNVGPPPAVTTAAAAPHAAASSAAAAPTAASSAAHELAGASGSQQPQHAHSRQGPPNSPVYVPPPGVKWTGPIGFDARGQTFDTLISASIWCSPLRRERGPATGRSSNRRDPTQCNNGAFASMEALHNMKLVITKECTEQMSRMSVQTLEQRVLVDVHLIPEVGLLSFTDPLELKRFIQFGKEQRWYLDDNGSGVALGASAAILHDGPLRGYKLTVHVFTCASAWARQRLATDLPEEKRNLFSQNQAFIILVRLKPPAPLNTQQGRSQQAGSVGPNTAATQYPAHAWAAMAQSEKVSQQQVQPAATVTGGPPPPQPPPTPYAHMAQAAELPVRGAATQMAPAGPSCHPAQDPAAPPSAVAPPWAHHVQGSSAHESKSAPWRAPPYTPASGGGPSTAPSGAASAASAEQGKSSVMQPTSAAGHKGSATEQMQFSAAASYVPYSARGSSSQSQPAPAPLPVGSGNRAAAAPPPWQTATRVTAQAPHPEPQEAGAGAAPPGQGALPGSSSLGRSQTAGAQSLGVLPSTARWSQVPREGLGEALGAQESASGGVAPPTTGAAFGGLAGGREAAATAPGGGEAGVQLSWRSAQQMFPMGGSSQGEEHPGWDTEPQQEQGQEQGASQQEQELCVPASPVFAFSSDEDD